MQDGENKIRVKKTPVNLAEEGSRAIANGSIYSLITPVMTAGDILWLLS